ncbi:NAD(P)-dependent oxidoreductase [Sandaracinus amylolyticus]|uniref:D-3-phosphoglycerate dehydrogenase n=1 Tax=Sandaracinus amylolyticus TaxID=927083 RepID=A0A0F6W1A8_9BACT|nr:NAD(P)-dependent oxidoreductase [Sandaracinus amylolyticus]AKF04943.1 D-3-phosphoglycerate dehydrogenase [Sandaracinus amylolyticus]
MRILVADKLASFVPGRLQDLGARLDVDPKLEGETLGAAMRELDPEVLIVRSTKVTAQHVESGKSLSLIIRAGAGVNTIDMSAASARGVYVANCPGKNAAAVAELTIGHLINLDRRIADNVASLRAHRWDKKTLGEARGLRGRTLAVLGVGAIAREVIVRAQALGMRVVGWSRRLTEAQAEELGIVRATTPEAAVTNADAVSVHLALTPETDKRIGASVFAAMKPGAYFVNTSRGEVVDQDALLAACSSRGIRAGLDVFAKEPSAGQAPFEEPIADHPNVYGTCHVGASTDEAEEAVGEEVVRIVGAYQRAEPIPNCVNLAVRSAATHVVVVRHADRVGVLAHVLRILSEARHNVQGMENVVFSGGRAALARVEVVGEPSAEVLAAIGASADVFHVGASTI